ncbi:MAG TPA: adenosylcobinamide-GDP ribazoletransferase [Candidatus Nanoarchaeia archaeon]|nr:adenosylcobinamide-GDP ribazoletransferase [Candidatus Nanoarchaeia archaeon]
MWKAIKNLFAFLTVLPLRMDMDCLVDSAKIMWLFPLVGAVIGFLAGVFGWAVSLFVPSLVTGALALGVLLLLTGLHHTDGLLDFGDAVMYHGTAERKIEIMHDQLTGAGALGLGIMTYLVTALAFGELNRSVSIYGLTVPLIIPAVIVIESAAKLSMVVGSWAGKPVHKGMNSTFLDAMHGKRGHLRLALALLLSLVIAIPLLWFAGLITVLAAFLTGLSMVAVAHRHFKGVTGDVLGATNELARMVCVVVLLAVVR